MELQIIAATFFIRLGEIFRNRSLTLSLSMVPIKKVKSIVFEREHKYCCFNSQYC